MRIAILGATSQIARDLVLSLTAQTTHELFLFARRPYVVRQWLENAGLTERHTCVDLSDFTVQQQFDVLINFVGVGNPAQAAAMGASILDITLYFDQLALDYLRVHPACRYLFLSSGAAYGASFEVPVDATSMAILPLNDFQSQDWYGVAKLHAECRHRAQSHLAIVDIRVFNYFSRTQDMSTRFFISDILRSIREQSVLMTSPEQIFRDFLHPSDFYRLIEAILNAPPRNTSIDCYSRGPVDKASILTYMQENFGLRFRTTDRLASVNATGNKPFYYSLNRRAGDFGYEPAMTSLECIAIESTAILNAGSD
jgi:nucleoside-diphosphate-sugar epimerase